MERYRELVGKRVEVEYRAGDLHLSAVGTLVAVKERSIFLEDRITQGEKSKNMRTEIPHVNFIRVTEVPAPAASAPAAVAPLKRRR